MSLRINFDASAEVSSLETYTLFGEDTVVVSLSLFVDKHSPFGDKYAVKLRYPKTSTDKPGETPEQGVEFYDYTHTLIFPSELQAKKVFKALTNNHGKSFVRKL